MSGQKQKRPYKRREASNADGASIPTPVLAGHDKYAHIGQIPLPEPDLELDEIEMMLERYPDNITAETVARVEAAVGRTSNAWGMVDPLELIRAVDRVLRG